MKYLLIDGENLRKTISLFLQDKNDFLNINILEILKGALGEIRFDKIIWYGAKLKVNKNDIEKSKKLIDFQRRLFSNLRNQNIELNLSGRIQNIGKVFREKGVDVALATDMVSFVFEIPDIEIYLFSNDSDLVPAIRKARSKNVNVNYITIDGIITKSILFHTNSVFILKKENIKKSLEIKTPAEFPQAGAGMSSIIADDKNESSEIS
jgi:uncharacterized LabA/DUF88 family protein